MKKILLTTFGSLLIYGGTTALILENTWDGFKYRFFMGTAYLFLPFLIGCIIYHVLLKSLSGKIGMLKTFPGQIVLGLLISWALVTVFLVVDRLLYDSDHLSILSRIKKDWDLIIGPGVSVSVVYYFVSKFFFKDESA